MATGNMTVTTADKHIGEVWPGAVIRAEEFALVIAPRVWRKWKFAGHGDVYHYPRIPNIEAQTKAASTDWDPKTYTDTEQTLTINVHQVAGFLIEDIVKVLANTDLEREMRNKIGYSLGRAVDVNLATLPQSFSQIVGTLGSELTYDQFVRAWQYLMDAGVMPGDDDVTAIVSPAAYAGLLKVDTFINAQYRSDENKGKAVEKARIGTVLNSPIFISNLTRAPSAGQSESFLFDRRAIALMMAQGPKMVKEYHALSLGNVVGSHQIYGYVEVNRYAETPGNVSATDTWAVLLRTIG